MSLLLAAAALAAASPPALIDDDPEVQESVLVNRNGMRLRVINLGAIVSGIDVPDGNGGYTNVVLGYGRESEYRQNSNGFGATIGRYAGRIAKARFTLDDQAIALVPNLSGNALHGGGIPGFHTRIFKAVPDRAADKSRLTYQLVSPDGDQGFPGEVTLTVTYRLEEDDSVHVDYRATTTMPTVLNLTNHSYFNLAGQGTIEGHDMRIAADRWVEADDQGIPTGRYAPVAGTPLDFRSARRIGENIDRPMAGKPKGYNQAWLLAEAPRRTPALAVSLHDPVSKRSLDIYTIEPSVQVYSGEYFSGRDVDAQGRPLPPRSGIALETQHLADSPNQSDFPTTILRPGQTFTATTIWRFSMRPDGSSAP